MARARPNARRSRRAGAGLRSARPCGRGGRGPSGPRSTPTSSGTWSPGSFAGSGSRRPSSPGGCASRNCRRSARSVWSARPVPAARPRRAPRTSGSTAASLSGCGRETERPAPPRHRTWWHSWLHSPVRVMLATTRHTDSTGAATLTRTSPVIATPLISRSLRVGQLTLSCDRTWLRGAAGSAWGVPHEAPVG